MGRGAIERRRHHHRWRRWGRDPVDTGARDARIKSHGGKGHGAYREDATAYFCCTTSHHDCLLGVLLRRCAFANASHLPFWMFTKRTIPLLTRSTELLRVCEVPS